MIWTAYPDKICYHPGCDVHKCLVLLPDGVALDRGARRASSWGIRMELLRIATRDIAHYTRVGILSGRLSTFFRYFISGIPCTDISYPKFRAPTFYIRNSVRRHFTSGYLTAGWERRTFQLLRSDISGSSDSAYLESFSLSIQCHGVLLKLPDISDRHFEIFWDVLL